MMRHSQPEGGVGPPEMPMITHHRTLMPSCTCCLSQIGWEAPVFGPRRAKTSSEETRFASEMIRSGVY